MPSKPGPGQAEDTELFSRQLSTDLCRWHREIKLLHISAAGTSRNRTRNVLAKSARNTVSPVWLTQLECSLYYASSACVDRRYHQCSRDASANLRRSESAFTFPPDVWPFLSFMVLSRDNQALHLERVRHGLSSYEKSGQITDIEKQRLTAEIEIYKSKNPPLYLELTERLNAEPKKIVPIEPEGDWEGPATCPHCKSKKTRSTDLLQMRSGDEPMTNFFACYNCKQTFNDNHDD